VPIYDADEIPSKVLKNFLQCVQRYVYFCPHCRKVLGFSHRQGYLLGS
jgi:hypothetical protein